MMRPLLNEGDFAPPQGAFEQLHGAPRGMATSERLRKQ